MHKDILKLLNNLTANMDLTLMRHLSQDLVAFLTGKLYSDESFMYKALEIINNITREKPGTTVDIFIKYEIE